VTGAGTDWLEAHFIMPTRDMSFAAHVAAFASDVLCQEPRNIDKFEEQTKRDNGFYLVWDLLNTCTPG
jgi:hypothetical protein